MKYTTKIYETEANRLELKIPNIEYAKENNLLIKTNKYTPQIIEQNLISCGFNDVKIIEFKGAFTKVSIECCNVKCSNTLIKQYINCISHKEIPYCKECAYIIRHLPRKHLKKKLADIRPDLKKYYHAEDNRGIEFQDISRGSGKKIFLRCDVCNKLQNEQQATVPSKYTRIKKTNGLFHSNFKCSYCNSLGVKFSDIAQEWDYESNIGTPFDYPYSSHKKVKWRCSKNHTWMASIGKRTIPKRNCPYCASSKGEIIIADYLKKLDVEFVQQHSAKIDDIIRFFDFYIKDFNLYIEVHGIQHYEEMNYFTVSLEEQQEIDSQKKKYAKQNGYYMAVDYREHDPELTLERFMNQFDIFLKQFIDDCSATLAEISGKVYVEKERAEL